ncbi:pyridoxine 5'-phosphate synthase [Membranicola marinus]|uniref:Pyridoxine 5'-phosphate synthase n=1 Tax=Membranihabitans marinus TaxID=1227546 RepID=A0A953HTK4_9BACT|nr:pyridoxine 5'-phosphate synthase [Membranihabitans marinus]MBY5957633.1 pyridoxine 5'-phosphate synthase [Membranihabitans marinus]
MSRTKLSVNINKVALIRNARGESKPDLLQFARDCESYGADGITVHPRPDERHVRYDDVPALKDLVRTELNVEGNPTPEFMKLVLDVVPHQCTLVPDDPGALTSDQGWDARTHQDFLSEVIGELHQKGIRVSIFVNDDPSMMEAAAQTGADRVELYTGPFALHYHDDSAAAIESYIRTAERARELGMEVNAGHDLDLENLNYLVASIPFIAEVSIGHALISDALYYGIENTIQMYQQKLK